MTELERMLKDALVSLEQGMSDTLEQHAQRLNEQGKALQEMRKAVRQIQIRQEESTRQWKRLSDASTRLDTLLTRLNGLLGDG